MSRLMVDPRSRDWPMINYDADSLERLKSICGFVAGQASLFGVAKTGAAEQPSGNNDGSNMGVNDCVPSDELLG